MNQRRFLIYLLSLTSCLIATAETAPKEPVSIKNGFLTGNSFRELGLPAKRKYVAGFIDGAFIAPMFDAPKSELRWLERCVTGMTDEQLVAVVDKWMSENPARWHQSMNMLTFVALKEGCTK